MQPRANAPHKRHREALSHFHPSTDRASAFPDWMAGGSEGELEALERWLVDDAEGEGGDDPWARTGGVVASPVKERGGLQAMRFEDDFTAFVSAPAPVDGAAGNDAGEVELEIGEDGETGEETLSPVGGYSYRSLGSVSDFGEGEEDIPTREEVLAVSARIFGTEKPAIAPLGRAGDPWPEDEVASFDLSRIVSTLEGMKAEIAGMSDEGERRRAAARVALGLVYGLEREPVE
jgi:hypothetical protein